MDQTDINAIFLLLGWAIPFGWEAVTTRGWRRYGAAALAVIFLLMAALWIPLGRLLPSLALAITSLAGSPQSWLVLFVFVAALVIFTGPQFRKLSPRRNGNDVTWTAISADSIESVMRDFKEEIEALEGRLIYRISVGDDKLSAQFLDHMKGVQKQFEGHQSLSAQIAIDLGKLTKTVAAEREEIQKDLRNAEDARLSQLNRIHEEAKRASEMVRDVQTDLFQLLHWAASRATTSVLAHLLQECPRVNKFDPPLEKDARLTTLDTAQRWNRKVLSETRNGFYGREIVQNASAARDEGERLVREIPPEKRPASIDAYDFQEYFIAAHACERIAEHLAYVIRELGNGERDSLSRLHERLSLREKKD